MARTPLEDVNCSWARAAAVLGDQWSILILRDALSGVRTFSVFQQRIGVSKSVLSARLTHLVRLGILEKAAVGTGTQRFAYDLTEKGRALGAVMVSLAHWSNQWVFESGSEPWLFIDAQSGERVVDVRFVTTSGKTAAADQIRVIPGPGGDTDQHS
ncbi:MAG: helix-turn-helix domain-containing protein [Myxococcota bacterium]